MKTLCHLHIGRKFVPVPNYVGYFYGSDGFQEKKTSCSYAIVISQDVNIATLALLEHSYNKRNWEDAIRFCCETIHGYMLSLVEMHQAARFKEHLQFEYCDIEWTSTEYSARYVLALYWDSLKDIFRTSKSNTYYVRPFFKLNVLTGQYEKDI